MHSSIRQKPRVRWIGYKKEWRASLGNDHAQAATIDGAVKALDLYRAERIRREHNSRRYANHMQGVKSAAERV